MESPVRNSIIIGVVLIALSIVIILCFSAFSISKGTAVYDLHLVGFKKRIC